MLAKLFLLLISITLLLQSSCEDIRTEQNSSSTSTPASGSTSQSLQEPIYYDSFMGSLKTDVRGFFPNLRWLILLAQDFYPMTYTVLGNEYELFKNVIDDFNTTEFLTEKFQIKLNDLSNYFAG